MNGVTRQYQMEQTIMFEECSHDTDPRPGVLRMMASRNYLSYEETQNIIRYIMTAKVGVSTSGIRHIVQSRNQSSYFNKNGRR